MTMSVWKLVGKSLWDPPSPSSESFFQGKIQALGFHISVNIQKIYSQLEEIE